MRTETEKLTRAYLRRRRDERRMEKIRNCIAAITLVAATVACAAYLVYLEWPAIMVVFG